MSCCQEGDTIFVMLSWRLHSICHVVREVTLFEELQLLKEFEKFENEMEEKVENKMMEKLQMMEKVGTEVQ